MVTRGTLTYNPIIGPSGPKPSKSTVYLATTADVMQFYLFDEPQADGKTPYQLIDRLDRHQLLGAGDKATAKTFAKRLGLKSWTYVRV